MSVADFDILFFLIFECFAIFYSIWNKISQEDDLFFISHLY